MDDLRSTIASVAQQEGIDPAYALAVAERESSLNPNAGGTGTIRGLFQMTRANRRKYGLADDASPEDQTRAFAKLTRDTQAEMQRVMGLAPTPEETYLGHHFGGVRGGRTAAGHYDGMAPSDVFNAQEMAGNPHFGRAPSMAFLARDITGDIKKRMGKFAGNGGEADFAQFGQPVDLKRNNDASAQPATGSTPRSQAGSVDFAQFGQPLEQGDHRAAPGDARAEPGHVDFAQFGEPAPAMSVSSSSNEGAKTNTRPGTEIDLAQFGMPRLPQRPEPTPGDHLKDLEAEMTVRQNSPDPGDTAFQGTLQQLQPQPQNI